MRTMSWRATTLMIGCWMTTGCTAPTQNAQDFLSRVDHLVYGTQDLERTIDEWEDLLGVRARYGGQHVGQGTHNAVLALAPATYLEILAPDPNQSEPDHPRWLGIDGIAAPRMLTWAAKGRHLESIVSQAENDGIALGCVLSGSRNRPDGSVLAWKLTDPHRLLADGLIPFFIDWGDSPHPATSAPTGCALIALRAEHPNAIHVRKQLERLGLGLPVAEGAVPALIATIRTPQGIVELR